MKKVLALFTLFGLAVLLVGCWKKDEPKNNETSASEEICGAHGWYLTNWAEWWDIAVCAFDDESFCFIENLEDWSCEKWFLYFEDDENSEIEDWNIENEEIDNWNAENEEIEEWSVEGSEIENWNVENEEVENWNTENVEAEESL